MFNVNHSLKKAGVFAIAMTFFAVVPVEAKVTTDILNIPMGVDPGQSFNLIDYTKKWYLHGSWRYRDFPLTKKSCEAPVLVTITEDRPPGGPVTTTNPVIHCIAEGGGAQRAAVWNLSLTCHNGTWSSGSSTWDTTAQGTYIYKCISK